MADPFDELIAQIAKRLNPRNPVRREETVDVTAKATDLPRKMDPASWLALMLGDTKGPGKGMLQKPVRIPLEHQEPSYNTEVHPKLEPLWKELSDRFPHATKLVRRVRLEQRDEAGKRSRALAKVLIKIAESGADVSLHGKLPGITAEGMYDIGGNEIVIYDDLNTDEMRSSMIHELQHAVDRRNFTDNFRYARKSFPPDVPYRDRPGEARAFQTSAAYSELLARLYGGKR